jgi:alanyl-tRNA synthetase
MLGNFSFGGDYEVSVELWHSFLTDFNIKVDNIHVHPESSHHELWKKRGYEVVDDLECVWSDGQIGGYCSEVYSRGIEIGNLVNTLGHSTDVGFGWERLFLITEGKERVDQTSLFGEYHPIVADHVRTLNCLWQNGISPGCKGRNYICQRLLRRLLLHLDGGEKFVFDEWLKEEERKRQITLNRAQRMWRRHKDKPAHWWKETCGLLPEEVALLRR